MDMMKLEEIYEYFNEEKRLNSSNASSVEFITTTNFIDKYLKKESKILDIGAATGAYSLHYAEKGYDVTSIEPVKRNVDILEAKITEDMNIKVYQGNALDLSYLEDNSFDVVLCFGPLYHLKSDEDKLRVINESKRVCKKDGKILFAYLSNDMVFVTETFIYNTANHLLGDEYDKESFKLVDETPFCFMTVGKMEELMIESNLNKVTHFAADGLAELMADKINKFSKDEFNEWMRFHLYTCEKPELLGYSNHVVFVASK